MKEFVPETNQSKQLHEIEHFEFEEDFVKKAMGCIPMIVRFKLDAVGIKLNLSEWSKFSAEQRVKLASQPCTTNGEEKEFRNYVRLLVNEHSGHEPMELSIDRNPGWTNLHSISTQLQAKAKEFGWEISLDKWGALTNLQRFALIKLCRPGHENKNFPKAMKESNMV
jgi:hypothetical protein